MTDKIISLRIDESLHEKMKSLEYVNWSAFIRKFLTQELEKQELRKKDKMENALEEIKKIQKSKVFDNGKDSAQIIREWRNKRKS